MLVEHLRDARRAVAPTGAAARSAWVDLCDSALAELWETTIRRLTGGAEVTGVALVAVGSLGRKDCGPESDLDLVLLHDGKNHPEIDGGLTALADGLWYPLWDSHVDLDHSVRSLAECRDIASKDLSASVALLDIRRIAGDAELVEKASEAIHSDWRRGARLRFDAIDADRAARIARAGELANSIEGDLKEAAGGFRDVTMLRALVASWLAERPAIDYGPSYTFLLDVRDALATITRRHDHVLAIRLHDEVARTLGITGEHAADTLLARISHAARTIQGAYRDTAARARRNAQPAHPRLRFGRSGKRQPVFDVVAPGVIKAGGELSLDVAATPTRAAMLSLLTASVRLGVPMRQATLVRCAASEAWGNEPWDASVREGIEEVLGAGMSQLSAWEDLDVAGCMVHVFPVWSRVRNVPQRSIIHRHTVDRHQLEAVALLGKGRAFDGRTLADLDDHHRSVLLMATLFHDIGKAPGMPGHAERGARLVPECVKDMGYSSAVVDDISALVRHHLLLGDLATSAAPDDPDTMRRIEEAVGGSVDLLACIHLLTQADAGSCKPEAWDPWKATLVRNLADNAAAAMVGKSA